VNVSLVLPKVVIEEDARRPGPPGFLDVENVVPQPGQDNVAKSSSTISLLS